jgi:hypothetical protein
MHRLLAVTALAVGLSVSGAAHAGRAFLTASTEGADLRVVVHGATDYCAGDADILRTRDSIRIVRQRPTKASRCVTSSDASVLVRDVAPGTYTVTYERIPLVAPARTLKLASLTVVVPER